MSTFCFGTIGVLASRTLSRLAGYCIVISSGTLLATIGAGEGAVLGGALFYLVSSTLGISAFYLLIELVERRDTDPNATANTVREAVFDDEYTGVLKAEREDEVGTVIPATIAILVVGFILFYLLFSCIPPLSGFT